MLVKVSRRYWSIETSWLISHEVRVRCETARELL